MTILIFLAGFFLGSLIPVYASLIAMLKNRLIGNATPRGGGGKPKGDIFND